MATGALFTAGSVATVLPAVASGLTLFGIASASTSFIAAYTNISTGLSKESLDGRVLSNEESQVRIQNGGSQMLQSLIVIIEGAILNTLINKNNNSSGNNSSNNNNSDDNQYNNPVIENMKERVNDDKVILPLERWDTPISQKDGMPIEIHHDNQNKYGPFEEKHATDHRFGENYKNNHPYHNKASQIDRDQFRVWKKEYWTNEWDKRRWKQ